MKRDRKIGKEDEPKNFIENTTNSDDNLTEDISNYFGISEFLLDSIFDQNNIFDK